MFVYVTCPDEGWRFRRIRAPSSNSDVARLNSFHAGLRHVAPRLCARALEVDGAAGILDYGDVEAGGAAVEGGPRDTEVGGEAADVELVEVALAQVAGKAGARPAIGFHEGGVAVDRAVVA